MHLTSPFFNLLPLFLAASTAHILPVPSAPLSRAPEPHSALSRRDVKLSGCGDILVSQVSGSTTSVNGCLDVNGKWVTDGACARYFVYGDATGTTCPDYLSRGFFTVSSLWFSGLLGIAPLV
ncbi:hypothetical protein HO173_002755 [Letharia columbiana]|uniref:SSCRP protein n=1 Tax=Letharia columbiana TaxID=112416 RepID=A0A8H6G1X8_9LECA|nr:uncharacterized protein HO173_002755 [Letharia columbiana]KAF6238883.1 hypothetical protein HO173_002755 [Letharia columbiana]